MGYSKPILANGSIEVDGEVVTNTNYYAADDRLLQWYFERYVRDDRNMWRRNSMQASAHFLRPSALRYTKPGDLFIWGSVGRPIRNYDSGWDRWHNWSGHSVNMGGTDYQRWRYSHTTPTILTGERDYPLGAIAWAHRDRRNGPRVEPYPNVEQSPAFPEYFRVGAAITWIDIPGTQIGTIFYHPPGRGALFNEVGQTASGQGTIEIDGPWNPPEDLLSHWSYQVYFTKTGGTGRPGDPANPDLTSAIDGVAGSVSTSSDTFTDGAGQNLFVQGVHDQGNHYIRVTGASNPVNNGTFLITSISAGGGISTCDVDASAINQPFTTEASLTWEMVSGPVGEYFWRRRIYNAYHFWSGDMRMYYGGLHHCASIADSGAIYWDQRTPPMQQIHDRGACWWGCTYRSDATSAPDGKLWRWLHQSPQSIEPMGEVGRITGFPSDFNGFTDLRMDDQNKLWIVGYGNNSSWPGGFNEKGAVRIDPYPGGNSHTPTTVSIHEAGVTELMNNYAHGLVVDDSQAYVANSRVYIFHFSANPALTTMPDDGEGEGGISYTDDYGTTWKRIHVLHARTGTASVSIGTDAVTGSGTSFDTEFQVGDWIRFAGDARSYEITAIGGPTSMTISPNHVAGASGVAIQRGALTDEGRRIAFTGTVNNSVTSEHVSSPPCDYDSQGNVYWISLDTGSSRHVCKWDPGAGAMSFLDPTAGGGLSSKVAFSNNTLQSLAVHRIPNPTTGPDHPFHDSIWIAAFSQGVARIHPVFDGSHDRYHWTLTTDPAIGQFDMQTATSTHWNTAIKISPVDGQFMIVGEYASGSHDTTFHYGIHMSQNDPTPADSLLGRLKDFTPMTASTTGQQWSSFMATLNSRIADNGLNAFLDMRPNALNGDREEDIGAIRNSGWNSMRWDGGQWVQGLVNEHDTHLHFGTPDATWPGQWIVFPVAVGEGVRRMHPGWEFLDEQMNLRIRFLDTAPQAVDQDQQFFVDEQATVVNYVGRGKTNIQEFSFASDGYTVPSVLRVNEESVKNCVNPWTQDGGIDGYWSMSSGVSDNFVFERGAAEMGEWSARGNEGPMYEDHYRPWSDSNYWQYGAALRIPDEGEFAGDGSTTASSPNFVTAGGHTFLDPADVGKSIIIEGVNGATPDVDNGQAVILSVLSPTEVVTDKTFAATNAGLRWKLRDIPAVSKVVVSFEYSRAQKPWARANKYLYSSDDLGVTWTARKQALSLRDKTSMGTLTDYVDPGFYPNQGSFPGYWHDFSSNPLYGHSWIIDLSDLPENTRRRQYWRMYVVESGGANIDDWGAFANFWLFDDNFHPIGRPVDNYADDALDPLFNRMYPLTQRLFLYDGSGDSMTAVNQGRDFSDQVTVAGANFYLQTGTNNAQLSGNDFIGGNWVPEDVGKFIRIENANNVENDGWALVTAYVNSGQVTTDKAFTAETNTFDWQVLTIGENDRVVITDDVEIHPTHGAPFSDMEHFISDIPAQDTITFTTRNIPVTMSSKTFNVLRHPPDSWTSGLGGNTGDVSTLHRLTHSMAWGTIECSDPLEFVVLEEDLISSSATSGADTDGDSRVDTVILPVTLVTEAVVGDYLMLDGTGGRRVYEIKDIQRDVPGASQTTVQVTYDEIKPSGTFQWQVLRRRGLQQQMTKLIYFLKENTP